MMNRGVMQRQMFSNGGESNLRTAVEEQRLVQRKEDNLSQGAIEYLRVQKDYLIREIEKITGGLTPVDIGSLLKRSIPELENFLSQTKEKYQAPSAQQAIPSDMLMRMMDEEQEQELNESLPQMGRRDPNMTEQYGINPLTRMQQLQNDQMVSAGRPTPNVLNPEYDTRGQVGNIPAGRRESVPENFGGVNQQTSMEDDLNYLREKRRNQGLVNEGYAVGGEAVPNRLKGFSKLPESVQMQMNPSLAKRYQQGGIASMMDPASMPQGDPMMGGMPQGGQMDPEMMALMEAEAAGQAQGEQIGAMVGEQTMAGLDQAEDFQGAIDALRGNSVPMEGRYEELAGFVGDEDAMQTPQSVLAMVQPTIMMTEEGAVDSGIGQLMEQITGNIAMETPDGQPTQMAEGVGSLMGVGQQPTEKKLLADGGAVGLVPAYKLAGEVSYDDILKRFQTVGGDPQARKDALQSDIYFNLADRALAFAGGVDPRTGENMAGAPLLSQVGRSAAGLGGTIAEKLAAQRAQDQASDTAALSRTLSQRDILQNQNFLVGMEEKKNNFEMLKMAEQFNYTKLANEDQFSYSTRLAEQGGRITRGLARLKGEIDADAQKIKDALERELNNVNNTLKTTLQNNKFNQQDALKLSDQEFEEAAQNRSRLNALQLASVNDRLKRSATKEDVEYKAFLEKEQLKIKQSYAVVNQSQKLKDDIKLLGVKTTEELITMEKGQKYNLAGIRLQSSLIQKRNDAQNANNATQAAIQRVFKSGQDRTSRNFERILRLELQENGFEDAALDRELAKRQQIFDNIITEQKMDLEESKETFDQAFDTENLAITRLESEAKKANVFGTGKTGGAFNVVTNQDNLNAYANNSFAEGSAINQGHVEAALSVYVSPEMDYSTDSRGKVIRPGNELTTDMKNALKARIDNGLAIPNKLRILLDEKPKSVSKYVFKADGSVDVSKVTSENMGEVLTSRNIDPNVVSFPDKINPNTGKPEPFFNKAENSQSEQSNATFNNRNLRLTSSLFTNVNNPLTAFGSPSFLANLVNKGMEALSFDKYGAPYGDTKEAIAGLTNLNDDFIKVYMKASGVRDSVFAQQELKQSVPPPGRFWTGDDTAMAMTRSLLLRIQGDLEIKKEILYNEEIPLSKDRKYEIMVQIMQLEKLERGYSFVAGLNLFDEDEDEELSTKQDEILNNLKKITGIEIPDRGS